MSNFDKERANYWANIDTESGDHVDERGTRIPRLATQDWRGHWLREALDRIEELERALGEAVGIAHDLNGDNGDDEELVRRRDEINALAALLPASKEQP